MPYAFPIIIQFLDRWKLLTKIVIYKMVLNFKVEVIPLTVLLNLKHHKLVNHVTDDQGYVPIILDCDITENIYQRMHPGTCQKQHDEHLTTWEAWSAYPSDKFQISIRQSFGSGKEGGCPVLNSYEVFCVWTFVIFTFNLAIVLSVYLRIVGFSIFLLYLT